MGGTETQTLPKRGSYWVINDAETWEYWDTNAAGTWDVLIYKLCLNMGGMEAPALGKHRRYWDTNSPGTWEVLRNQLCWNLGGIEKQTTQELWRYCDTKAAGKCVVSRHYFSYCMRTKTLLEHGRSCGRVISVVMKASPPLAASLLDGIGCHLWCGEGNPDKACGIC